MFRLKRILLIAPAEMTRTPAFDRAQALARASGAVLHIVAFDHVQSLALAGLIDHDAMAQAREGYLQMHRHWLEQQARFQRGAGVQVSTEVVWARATPAHVLEYINDFHVDLVIKDAHHVSALNQTFHPPLDWLLVRDCPACVHLVTEAAHPKPLKILAAIDLSHLEDLTQGLNDRILGVASTLAAKCDAPLHLLNVANWSVVGDAAMSVPNLSLDHSLRDAINDTQQEAFDTLAERYGLDEEHSHLLSGVPFRVIEDFARQHAFDLLVLGICHHQALDGFIGGTAECLMNRAPCSLLMVKAMPATA